MQHGGDAGGKLFFESPDFYIRVAISFVLVFTTGNRVLGQ